MIQNIKELDHEYSRTSALHFQVRLCRINKVKNSGTPAALIPAFITGLSLYTIPSWATDNFEVTAVAKNRQGLSKEYALTDSTTLVQWLPMVLVFPFKNFSVIPEVRKNMYRTILAKMKEDGFITNDATLKISALGK